MSKEEYNAVKAALNALPIEDIKRPTMPVANITQEAEDMAVWAKADLELLAKAGLNLSLVEELPTRSGALRFRQSEWVSDKNTRSENIKLWSEKAPIGFNLVDECNHFFRFAFHDNADLLKRVDEIAEGGDNADMIQDLMNYATLGKDNVETLKTVGFDVKKLDQAAILSEELAEVLAYNNNDKQLSNELKEERDRAYTYLYHAVKEVRRVGKFVFWRTPERKKGYVSQYFK